MGNLFGKKKTPPSRVSDQDRAVLQLKQQRDKIKQYLRRVETSMEKDRRLARQLIQDGKKEKALLLLRKKRYQETLIERAENQLTNLEQMVTDIETAQMQMDVMDSLSVGNECLKDLHRMMSVEDVERILEDTRESVEYQQEIDNLLSGVLTQQDESDVLDELNQILSEGEDADELHLPEVPEDKLPQAARVGKRGQKAHDSNRQALAAT